MRAPDDDGFTEFVRQHAARLTGTARLLTGDRGLAEDLVQTALARAYGRWSRVQETDDPLAYVYRIMINAHLSWRRRRSSSEQVVAEVPDRWADDLQSTLAGRDEMARALAQLSPRVRTAVVLRYFDDLSEVRTAAAMGCSVSTVNNHVTRGLAALRGLLATDGDTALTTLSGGRP